MSDFVGTPKDRVSHDAAHLIKHPKLYLKEKTSFQHHRLFVWTIAAYINFCQRRNTFIYKNQRTNGLVNAHLIFGPSISTKHTKPGKNKVKKT